MKATFKKKFTEAGNAVSFIFTPNETVQWSAGQYTEWTIKDKNGEPLEHYFTISSAPYEGYLKVTTRLTGSKFKNTLNDLQPGDEITITEPRGKFAWEDSDLPRIFVAFGIGVTPYHSIVKQRAHEEASIGATLLYFNRNDEIPFKAEFDKWQNEHPEFEVAYIVEGNTTYGSLVKHIGKENLQNSLIYLSGPEDFIGELSDQLQEKDNVPKANLRHDWFQGYKDNSY